MTRDKSLVLGLGLGVALAVLLGSASPAQAQYAPGYGPPPGYYGPPRGVYRSGLVLGFGIGGGFISASNCPNCGGGIAGELHIGGMVNPRLAAMLDIWGVDHIDGNGNSLSNSFFTGAIQYWVLPQLWLKGGIGLASVGLSDASGFTGPGNSETAFGLLGAGGVEVVQTPSFALDLQLRLGYGAYSGGGATNLALLVGLNWY
jgi:hypothetical protein